MKINYLAEIFDPFLFCFVRLPAPRQPRADSNRTARIAPSGADCTKKRVEVSVGESLRILRELQGLSQSELARLTGIPQATISAVENDRVNLGVERAKIFARAVNCHPAVLVFPGWEIRLKSAA
jgi:DNA-binding XRE family transcriptional regulator